MNMNEVNNKNYYKEKENIEIGFTTMEEFLKENNLEKEIKMDENKNKNRLIAEIIFHCKTLEGMYEHVKISTIGDWEHIKNVIREGKKQLAEFKVNNQNNDNEIENKNNPDSQENDKFYVKDLAGGRKETHIGANCPYCGNRVWDNRQKKADGFFEYNGKRYEVNPNIPDFTCRDKTCGAGGYINEVGEYKAVIWNKRTV